MPRSIIPVSLTPQERLALSKLAKAPAAASALRQRAKIILCLGDGLGQVKTARKLKISEPTVSFWRKRYEKSGIEALNDLSGKGRKNEISAFKRSAVIRALGPAKEGEQVLTQRRVARVLEISLRSVQRIWEEHLKGHPEALESAKKRMSHRSKPKVKYKGKKRLSQKQSKDKDNASEDDALATVSISQIARAANVSASTASRALRDDPRHSQQTRLRIQSIAIQMGYRENPYVRSLMTAIRHNKKMPTQGTLALVFPCARKASWKAFPGNEASRAAVYAQAHRHGFVVDEFWSREEKMGPKRLAEVIKSRNIRGVILVGAGFLEPHQWTQWSSVLAPFAVVNLNSTPSNPVCHYVISNQYDCYRLAYESLVRLNYERIGLVTSAMQNRIQHNRVISGFFSLAQEKAIPEIEFSEGPVHKSTILKFKKWFNQYQPDAIFAVNHSVIPILKTLGISFPDDVGLAMNRVNARTPFYSGIKQNEETIATTAVDFIVNRIYLNEYGFSRTPIGTQIQGEWFEGNTLRKQPTKKALTKKR